MKVLVVHRKRELYERFEDLCRKSTNEYARSLSIEYAKDTNAERFGEFEAYVRKMEKEGPEWIEPDEDVINKIVDADILLTEWGGISSKVIAAGKCIKLIATIRSGLENINVDFAHRRGIKVCIAPSRLANPVADMTIALMLSECRGLLRRNLRCTNGEWVDEKYDDESHSALCNLKIGIVGYGGIARVVAQRLVKGFDCEVLAYETITPRETIESDGVRCVSLDELCRSCDIISLHARLTVETRKIIGEQQFNMMKPNAIVINTARGELIDENALIEALQSHKIRGAGLDVYAVEPLPKDSRLLQMDNVTLMPHSSGITNDTVKNSLSVLYPEIERFLNNEELIHPV